MAARLLRAGPIQNPKSKIQNPKLAGGVPHFPTGVRRSHSDMRASLDLQERNTNR